MNQAVSRERIFNAIAAVKCLLLQPDCVIELDLCPQSEAIRDDLASAQAYLVSAYERLTNEKLRTPA